MLQGLVFILFLVAAILGPIAIDNYLNGREDKDVVKNFGRDNWNMDFEEFLKSISKFSEKDFNNAINQRNAIIERMNCAREVEEDRLIA